MDENMKFELKPQFDYESECKSVELEIINPKNLVDARLDEIDNQIADLDMKAAQGSIREIENIDISAIDANNKGLTAEILDNL